MINSTHNGYNDSLAEEAGDRTLSVNTFDTAYNMRTHNPSKETIQKLQDIKVAVELLQVRIESILINEVMEERVE